MRHAAGHDAGQDQTPRPNRAGGRSAHTQPSGGPARLNIRAGLRTAASTACPNGGKGGDAGHELYLTFGKDNRLKLKQIFRDKCHTGAARASPTRTVESNSRGTGARIFQPRRRLRRRRRLPGRHRPARGPEARLWVPARLASFFCLPLAHTTPSDIGRAQHRSGRRLGLAVAVRLVVTVTQLPLAAGCQCLCRLLGCRSHSAVSDSRPVGVCPLHQRLPLWLPVSLV